MLSQSNLLYHVQPQQLTLVRLLNIHVQLYTNVLNCEVRTDSCSPPASPIAGHAVAQHNGNVFVKDTAACANATYSPLKTLDPKS